MRRAPTAPIAGRRFEVPNRYYLNCLAVGSLNDAEVFGWSAPPSLRRTEVPLMAAELFFEVSWNRTP